MDQVLSEGFQSIFPISSRSDDEQTYFRIIDEAIGATKPRVISNGRPAHAIYLIYKFLACVAQNVRIYTGSLKRHLDDNLAAYADQTVISTAIGFLRNPTASLCVVIADELDTGEDQSVISHPMVKEIQDANVNGEFTLFRETTQRPDFTEHLLIMDDQAVRVETDPRNTKAFVSFGDREVVSLANRLFEDIKKDCEQLYPVPSSV